MRMVSPQNRSPRRLKPFHLPGLTHKQLSFLQRGLEQYDFNTFSYIMQ